MPFLHSVPAHYQGLGAQSKVTLKDDFQKDIKNHDCLTDVKINTV